MCQQLQTAASRYHILHRGMCAGPPCRLRVGLHHQVGAGRPICVEELQWRACRGSSAADAQLRARALALLPPLLAHLPADSRAQLLGAVRELLDDVSPVTSWELTPGAAAGYGAQVAALFGAAVRAAEVGADVGSLLEVMYCCSAPIPEKRAQAESARSAACQNPAAAAAYCLQCPLHGEMLAAQPGGFTERPGSGAAGVVSGLHGDGHRKGAHQAGRAGGPPCRGRRRALGCCPS